MKLSRTSLLTFFLVLCVAFLLSACSHDTPAPQDTSDDETAEDDDMGVVDDEDTFGEDEDEAGDEDIIDDEDVDETDDNLPDEEEEVDEPEEEPDTGSTKASISGSYCYPTSPIPTNLRAYVKNSKSGSYHYITRNSKTSWTVSELDPGTYNVYLAGPDGSGLEEGRYLNPDNSWKTITLNAGDAITGIQPCDFDF